MDITHGSDITAPNVGAVAYTGGKITLTGGTITINGTGTGSKFGIQAYGGTIISSADIVMAGAEQWYGVYARDGGTIILNGGTLTANENGIRGLYTGGAGSNISGTMDINVVGSNAYGADIQTGGKLTLTEGSITNSGRFSMGVTASGNTTVKLSDVTIDSSGYNSIGVYSNGIVVIDGGTITASEEIGVGIYAGVAGFITSSATISTSGKNGYGARTTNGTVDLVGGSITTTGERAFGAAATAGGTINAKEGTISTGGKDASGLYSTGANSTINNFIDVTTMGNFANGAHAITNGTVNLEAGTVKTSGQTSHGAGAELGGTINASGGRITTMGVGAHGLDAKDLGSVITSVIEVATLGDLADGAHAAANATINLNAGLVKTSGQESHGAVATSGGKINLAEVAIATSGNGSYGLFSIGASSDISGVADVRTTGNGAHASAVASGGYLNISGSLLSTVGNDAAGLFMTDLAGSGSAGTAIFDQVTLSTLGGSSMLIHAGTANISFTDSVAIDNNGQWLNVASSDLANPAIANVALERSSVKGAAITDIASTSRVNLSSESAWFMTGNSNLTTLANTGTIEFSGPIGNPASSAGYKTLTVNNYVGNGGTIVLNTYLDGDGSPSDKLVINGGSATGSTLLRINDTGGPGAYTYVDGIQVVEARNGATTTEDAFRLGNRVAAGGYEYRLDRSGRDQSWYLVNSTATDPDSGGVRATIIEVPNYRVEVPLMTAVTPVAMEYGYAMLGTLHERVGDTWNAPLAPAYEEKIVRGKDGRQAVVRVPVARTAADQSPWFSGAWGRLIGDRGFQRNGNFERNGPSYDYTFTGIQTGLDIFAKEQADGTLDKLGIYVGYGQIDANVKGAWQGKAGTVDMDVYTVGAYWTHKAAAGWYTDAVVQGTWYQADAKSIAGQRLKTDGFGFLASLETGYAFNLGNGFTLEPQAQLVYQNVSFDKISDAYGRFDLSDGESLRGRLGVRLTKSWNMADEFKPRMLTTWLRANVWHEFMGGSSTTVTNLTGDNPLKFNSSLKGTWAEIGAGVSGQVSENVSLFATAAYNRSLDNKGREAWNGRIGFTVKW